MPAAIVSPLFTGCLYLAVNGIYTGAVVRASAAPPPTRCTQRRVVKYAGGGTHYAHTQPLPLPGLNQAGPGLFANDLEKRRHRINHFHIARDYYRVICLYDMVEPHA